MSLLTGKQQLVHPRAQVQTLRRIAQSALRKGDLVRARAATDEMDLLNEEHDLGYPRRNDR